MLLGKKTPPADLDMLRPDLHIGRAGAGTGEAGHARMRSSPWLSPGLLLVSFIWQSGSWGAEWSPLALIPHTCGAGGALRAALPAPHRCGKVPGVGHAQQTSAYGCSTTWEGKTLLVFEEQGCHSHHVSPAQPRLREDSAPGAWLSHACCRQPGCEGLRALAALVSTLASRCLTWEQN